MKKWSLSWYLVIPFAIGFIIGYQQQSKSLAQSNFEPEVLQVLVPANAIPEDLIENFQAENRVSVNITTYASVAELRALVDNGFEKYDLALVGYAQVPQLKQEGRVLPIATNLVPHFANLSPDFRDLPTDPGSTYSIPLYWGVRSSKEDRAHLATSLKALLSKNPHLVEAQVLAREFWITGSSKSKSSIRTESQESALWVQSFVIPKDSHNMKSALGFIDFFLQGEVATELAKVTMNSSTNRQTEKRDLDATLKPSHLRNQRLAQIMRSVR